ncbi:MAG: imidazole glycerol phosphate synthase subunit HisH [Candidatus Omnitrophota bacterium]
MIAMVDYGMGNLKSVENSALFLGKMVKVSSSPAIINKAKKIIFPGVGHFGRAVKELKKRKLFDLLRKRIAEGVPFLGICLGMQLLLEKSQEAPGIKGLGVIRGQVRKFVDKKLIVPHMGWNQVEIKGKGRRADKTGEGLFRGIKDGSFFYFAHSYYCQPKESSVILSTTTYGSEFASSLHKENIWAVQFHPEKSQKLGLKVFNNFLKIC